MSKLILTGTACAGKSTLLQALAERGYQTFPEAETPLVEQLQAELGQDGAKRWIIANYAEFKRQVGEKQQEIDSVPTNGQPAFYDRSAICYSSGQDILSSITPAAAIFGGQQCTLFLSAIISRLLCVTRGSGVTLSA